MLPGVPKHQLGRVSPPPTAPNYPRANACRNATVGSLEGQLGTASASAVISISVACGTRLRVSLSKLAGFVSFRRFLATDVLWLSPDIGAHAVASPRIVVRYLLGGQGFEPWQGRARSHVHNPCARLMHMSSITHARSHWLTRLS